MMNMAFTRLLVASLLVSLLLFPNTNGHQSEATQTSLPAAGKAADSSHNLYDQEKIDCGVACAGRCQLSSRPRLCKRACGTCCNRCNCVPPGTSGNYEACSCYASLTTHGNRRKCP